MRTSVASISKKFISTFFAATLTLGLVPAAAFAADEPTGEESPQSVISSEVDPVDVADDSQGEFVETGFIPSNGEEGIEDSVTDSDESNLSIPAATQRVNEDVALTSRTVAQAESTRSYFLAQTLESTRTVPIVSANLPLDMTVSELQAPEIDAPSQEEGGDEEDDGPDPAIGSNAIAAESVVVGSFEYRGITYAVEPGGESVAVVAADYSKLPEEFIEAQTIVLPSMVTSDGIDYYSVTRIADNAFASLNHDTVSSVGASEEPSIGITALTIPASVTEIGEDAFTGFDTLQYVIVSEDNPNYGMYDGCLYDADQSCLLLIPEGRLGAVRIAPSVTEVDPEVFSHCPSVDTLVADADSAAYQLLEANGLDNPGISLQTIELSSEQISAGLIASYSKAIEISDEELMPLDSITVMPSTDQVFVVASASDSHVAIQGVDLQVLSPGVYELAVKSASSNPIYQILSIRSSSDKAAYLEESKASLSAPPGTTGVWLRNKYGNKPALLYCGNAADYYGDTDYYSWISYWPDEYAIVRSAQYSSKNWSGFIRNRDSVAFPMAVQSDRESTHWMDHFYYSNGTEFIAANVYRNNQTVLFSIDWIIDWDYTTLGCAPSSDSPAITIVPERDSYGNEASRTGTTTYPTVRVPSDMQFLGWTTDPSGNTDGVLPDNGAPGWEDRYSQEVVVDGKLYIEYSYPATQMTPVIDKDTKYYALCCTPRKRNVVLNSNGADMENQVVWSEYGKAMSTKISNGEDGDSDVDLQVPQREGYVFTGYWNTRYSEDPNSTESSVPLTDGATISDVRPKRYYGVDDSEHPSQFADIAEWDILAGNQQLFAHWKYKIKLMDNAYDSEGHKVAASVDWDSIPQSGAGFSVVREGEGAPYIDARYGAPIPLPKATRAGYGDTRAWGLTSGAKGKAGWVVKETSDFWTAKADGTKASLADASYTKNGAATDAYSVTPGIDDHTLLLFASWLWDETTPDSDKVVPGGGKNKYDVRLKAAYEESGFTYAASWPEGTTLDKGDVVLSDVEYDAVIPDTRLSMGAPSFVSVTGPKSYDLLAFKGFYTEGNVPEPADGIKGTQLIAVTDTGLAGAFPLLVVPATGDEIVLYALWALPVTNVVFHLNASGLESTVTYAQAMADTSKLATKNGAVYTVSVKTNEVTPTISIALPTNTASGKYSFNGWWTHPYLEGPGSTQYYGADNRPIQKDGKVLAWKPYVDTVLYAHWTYTIEFDKNTTEDASIVHEGELPLVTGGRGTDAFGNVYSYEGDGPEVVSVRAVLGAPVKLPYVADRTGYDDTCAWSTTKDAASGTLPADEEGTTLKAVDGAQGKPAIAPDASGKVVLYADWSDAVHTYKVNLVAAYDGYAPDNDYATVMEDVVYGEPFLAAGESLVAPHIAGYRFIGYFTDKNGAGEPYTEATDNSNKGRVGCLRVNGSPKPFTVAGLENGDTVDLYAAYERLEYTVRFNTDAIQPADATKVSSVVSDLRNTPFSASELASYQGRLEANKHQATDLSEGFAASSLKLHYGDALAGEHALPTPALENGRTDTFWCTGYTFAGWYSFPIKADGALNVVYTEDGMVDLKASGAIRFKAGSYGSSHPVSEEKTSFDVEIADVENPTMTLYAVWERNAYSITWDETSSLSTQSVTAPTQLAYQIALYGSKVERTAPVFRDHVFAGTWHTSAACTGAAVVLDPYRPSASSSSSPVYFAKWDGTEEHAVYFYPGAHGSFEEGPYLEAPYLYADATSVSFGHYSQVLSRDAGYAFAGWREAASAEDAAAGIVKDGSSTPINSLSGVAGFSTRTDDIYLVAQYSARTYVIRLDANGGTELDPSSIEFKEADEGPILLPGASDMKLAGSTFVGWEDEDGELLATDEDAGVTVNPDGSASINPHLYVSSMEDSTELEIPLRAKWKPNAYVVRFNLWKDGSGTQGSDRAVSDVLEVPVLFGGTFEMPYPAAAVGSKRVFSHWGESASATRPDTTHTSWVPEAKVLFDADFLATLKTGPAYEVDADRYVLDLYAEFRRAISATLPTSASVHVDPHNPGAMIVTDTAISSDLLDEDDTALPVRVVSLSYSSIDGNGTQPGTQGAFAGSNGADSSKVKLAVYAKVEDDSFKGFTDELRDAEFVRTSIVPNSTVRFALSDAADVRTLADLEAGGFAPFAKGKRLHIVYSLAFDDGYDESDFVSSLPDANVVGADGLSRDKYDIARVCYTIGYAPKTN